MNTLPLGASSLPRAQLACRQLVAERRGWALLAVIAAETVLFAAVAPGFFTLGNFFEMTRFSVELGLLAVALTPVIVTGGIDLSVGSMMGLAAVVLRRRVPHVAPAAAGGGAVCAARRMRGRRAERVADRAARAAARSS